MIITAPNGKTFSLRCNCDYEWIHDDKDDKAIMVEGTVGGADICQKCGHFGWSMTQDKIDAISKEFNQTK